MNPTLPMLPGARWYSSAMAALLCVACAAPSTRTTPATPTPIPPSAPSQAQTAPSNSAPAPVGPTSAPLFERPSAGAAALRQGVAAFDMGEYRRAENKLAEGFKQGLTNTPDILRGYKTQAFVYCVTARTAQCEKSFEAAFVIDRKFKLTPGERQHPVWGPVFARVQKRYLT